MSRIDSLPPDQRAVLSLVLGQGKTYAQLAEMLHIDEDAVRSRAVAAIESLGPRDAVPPPDQRRAEIADYLLGQQTASQRAATRSYLEESAAGRAWARVVADELRPLARAALPEIPAEGAEVDEAFDAPQPPTEARARVQPSSRRGGAILLGGIAVVVVAVVLVIVLSSGGSSKHDTSVVGSTSTGSTTATGSTGTRPQVLAQINLRSPQRGSRAIGVVNVVAQGARRALAMVAQGLTPTTRRFAYAVWLYNSPADAQRLGFAPAVGRNGRLQAVAGLPTTANHFRRLIITRETTARPPRPGTIVLGGRLAL